MIKFVGAAPGDPELITVKGIKALQEAEVVLYTGSLVPRELLDWCHEGTIIENSADMSYDDIFTFFKNMRIKILFVCIWEIALFIQLLPNR